MADIATAIKIESEKEEQNDEKVEKSDGEEKSPCKDTNGSPNMLKGLLQDESNSKKDRLGDEESLNLSQIDL